MAKFKVGDRVRVAFPLEGWACRPESFLGASGVVTSWGEDADEAGGDIRLDSGKTWAFYASELEPEIVFAPDTPTLRDQFAMAALTGIARESAYTDEGTHIAAVVAYQFADAMLGERGRAK